MRGLGRLAARLSGAALCYGEPVESNGRMVIPVARVRLIGGGGGQLAGPAEGEGGGGFVGARPVGFVEVGPEGSRFHPIREPGEPSRRIVGALAVAAPAVAVALRIRSGLRGRGRPRQLPRGRR